MDGSATKVLVAEDYESNRQLLASLLGQAQYEVHLAVDGYEALERMLKGTFAAVITDWDMPKLNGSRFLAVSHILWPDTPVIIASAHALPSIGNMPRGVFAWLKKPYESQELLQVLRAAVQTSDQRRR